MKLHLITRQNQIGLKPWILNQCSKPLGHIWCVALGEYQVSLVFHNLVWFITIMALVKASEAAKLCIILSKYCKTHTENIAKLTLKILQNSHSKYCKTHTKLKLHLNTCVAERISFGALIDFTVMVLNLLFSPNEDDSSHSARVTFWAIQKAAKVYANPLLTELSSRMDRFLFSSLTPAADHITMRRAHPIYRPLFTRNSFDIFLFIPPWPVDPRSNKLDV